ncbi:MAG: hypothetical protein A2008_12545 [Candidatus Wallbacteria bacterium GWC2_49_35]|uniref:Type II secretion system protein GspC N-terminal domain-containing protein n=1 Tax=Candidatus Wallbacteria bacterium GWC2_49_35 TaxID=1817813 RepID=A0A1F7WTA8_9BACT|nr:MAG: hypothetical protein A2008_12545 [Candidatus Wallbacteria bacterium GWC2_49_35]HBC74499.1 hypothetical protein [Candidatus Wallbacteria bacterium]
MKKTTLVSVSFLILLAALLINAPAAFGEAAADADAREYSEKIKGKDPFQALVTPPPAVVPQNPDKIDFIAKPPVPVIEPLPIKVTFIVGSSNRKFATMCLNDKVYHMTSGDREKSGLFHVIEVQNDHVKIFDSRVQKERTIKLTEE